MIDDHKHSDPPIFEIRAYFKPQSNCQYVKVGEKTVDVMELKCDDGEDAK